MKIQPNHLISPFRTESRIHFFVVVVVVAFSTVWIC